MRLLFLFLFPAFISLGQQFPEGWIGNYCGDMHLFGGKSTTVMPVKFEVKTVVKDSVWTYRMSFFPKEGEGMTKEYRITKDATGYNLDEGDGIIIPMLLVENCFYDFYEMENMWFTSRLEKIGNNIVFELYGGQKSNPKVSKSEEGDITAHQPQFVQKVTLKPCKK